MLSNGGLVTLSSMHHIPFEIGVDWTATLPLALSSAKSLVGRSNEKSTSPRSINALRFPAEATPPQLPFFFLGGGRFFQSFFPKGGPWVRGVFFSPLNAPPPA